MELNKIMDVIGDVENKSNKDLFLVINELNDEFEKTKQLIIDLTRHMEYVEDMYGKVNNEIQKRLKK